MIERLIDDEKKRKEKMNSILEMSQREQDVVEERSQPKGSFNHFLKNQKDWEQKKQLKISTVCLKLITNYISR